MSRDRGRFAQMADSIERRVAGKAMKKAADVSRKGEVYSKDSEFHRIPKSYEVPKVVNYDQNDRGRKAVEDPFIKKPVKIDEDLDERNVDGEKFSLDATDRLMMAGIEALNFDDVPVAGYYRGMSDEEFAHRKRIYANRLENIQNYKSAVEAVNEWRFLIQKYYKQNFKAYKSQESRFVNAEDQTIKIFYNMLTHYNTAIDGDGARESRVLEYLRDALFKAVENIDQGIKDPKVAEAANVLRHKIGLMLDALLHYQISIEQKVA